MNQELEAALIMFGVVAGFAVVVVLVRALHLWYFRRTNQEGSTRLTDPE